MTVLPDVKEKHVFYSFKGEESWQPLTELQDIKCKRCGFYEKDTFKPSDVFDEWELCASDFTMSDGDTFISKRKSSMPHFYAQNVSDLGAVSLNSSEFPSSLVHLLMEQTMMIKWLICICFPASNHSSNSNNSPKEMHWAVILVICALASFVIIAGLVTAYKYWQKRKKQQEQARFLKLFEEGDDIEDELGIGPLSHIV
ncbi:UNVERIFIED_CONTAM: hypothetical protein Sradi_5921300 [Sesamum radiatum]|uniref:DUF7953 domain-containing protein n=1 Tax=Sesamum radiatum TaxID=300843 RepID=A0AAW2KUY5_SESRA